MDRVHHYQMAKATPKSATPRTTRTTSLPDTARAQEDGTASDMEGCCGKPTWPIVQSGGGGKKK
jgi:hypothetical protein